MAAVNEDVRSMAYDEVALAISEGEPTPNLEVVQICERRRSQPDADHIGFDHFERLLGGTTDGRFAPGTPGWVMACSGVLSMVSGGG